jgi:nucleoside-diphosphate-sugar epimerase
MTHHVLIAGCGDVGNALGKRLLDDGCTVWGVRRRIDALAPGIRPWPIDLLHPQRHGEPPARFDTLFFTASADRRDEDAYRAVYVHALQSLLEGLRAAACPLERVFFTSSTAVYGQSNGEWVDESSATEPGGFNGKVLLEAEKLIDDAPELGVNVRLSGIYGPGRTRLVRKVWSGEARATDGWTNRIHVEDCAGVLHHLMGLSNPEPLYLGSDDLPATTAEVVNWMAQQLGKPTPPPAPTTRRNKRCRNARLRESGYRFIYPSFRDGYPGIVEEFRRQSAPEK